MSDDIPEVCVEHLSPGPMPDWKYEVEYSITYRYLDLADTLMYGTTEAMVAGINEAGLARVKLYYDSRRGIYGPRGNPVYGNFAIYAQTVMRSPQKEIELPTDPEPGEQS